MPDSTCQRNPPIDHVLQTRSRWRLDVEIVFAISFENDPLSIRLLDLTLKAMETRITDVSAVSSN